MDTQWDWDEDDSLMAEERLKDTWSDDHRQIPANTNGYADVAHASEETNGFKKSALQTNSADLFAVRTIVRNV